MSEPSYGLHQGVVVAGADPDDRGRLQVRVPSLHGEAVLWAERCVERPGPAARLREGTRVWVQFEGGDPGRPVVVGCLQEPGRRRRPARRRP